MPTNLPQITEEKVQILNNSTAAKNNDITQQDTVQQSDIKKTSQVIQPALNTSQDTTNQYPEQPQAQAQQQVAEVKQSTNEQTQQITEIKATEVNKSQEVSQPQPQEQNNNAQQPVDIS